MSNRIPDNAMMDAAIAHAVKEWLAENPDAVLNALRDGAQSGVQRHIVASVTDTRPNDIIQRAAYNAVRQWLNERRLAFTDTFNGAVRSEIRSAKGKRGSAT